VGLGGVGSGRGGPGPGGGGLGSGAGGAGVSFTPVRISVGFTRFGGPEPRYGVANYGCLAARVMGT